MRCIIGRLRSCSWILSWETLARHWLPLSPFGALAGHHHARQQGGPMAHPCKGDNDSILPNGSHTSPPCSPSKARHQPQLHGSQAKQQRPGVASWASLHATCTRSHCVLVATFSRQAHFHIFLVRSSRELRSFVRSFYIQQKLRSRSFLPWQGQPEKGPISRPALKSFLIPPQRHSISDPSLFFEFKPVLVKSFPSRPYCLYTVFDDRSHEHTAGKPRLTCIRRVPEYQDSESSILLPLVARL